MKVMQNSLFDCLIAAHREPQDAAGMGKTPSALQKRPSEGICFREFPKRCGSPISVMDHHMKLPQQVMRNNCGHHIKMIAVKPPYGNIIQLALRLQFAERIFLRSSPMVKTHDLLHGRLPVRNDHREFMAVFMRNKQIELDRLFGLLLDHSPDKEETEAGSPSSWASRAYQHTKTRH